MALDNAMNHCQDSRLETEHLLILSGYACKRMTKFVKNFDKIEISYYKRCAAQNLQSNLSQEAGKYCDGLAFYRHFVQSVSAFDNVRICEIIFVFAAAIDVTVR